jgi:transcriptional regulator with XRE-family HTH domain
VARRLDPGAKAETRLAHRRIAAELTQGELAEKVGLSLPTYRRLERKKMRNPPLRYLINCGIVLGCHWIELIEPEWEQWIDLRLPDDRRSRGI